MAWCTLEAILQPSNPSADKEMILSHGLHTCYDCNPAHTHFGPLAAYMQHRCTHDIWPAVSAALPADCSLAHTPIVPLAARGSADASIIRRHLAALAPNWRLGTDHAKALPACVHLNATYTDFLGDDTFYIG